MGIAQYNLMAAWIGIFLGVFSGALIGLFFHREAWMGGYNSWRRRLTRLGHISFFGLAAINFAFFLTVPSLRGDDAALLGPSMLLLLGALSMPTICFLSAWRQPFRHAFFIPVASILVGTGWVLILFFMGRS